jgi:hypothetical protein
MAEKTEVKVDQLVYVEICVPLAGRFLSVLSVLSVPSRLSGAEHDQQCLAQAPPNVNRP